MLEQAVLVRVRVGAGVALIQRGIQVRARVLFEAPGPFVLVAALQTGVRFCPVGVWWKSQVRVQVSCKNAKWMKPYSARFLVTESKQNIVLSRVPETSKSQDAPKITRETTQTVAPDKISLGNK